jgi:hypothetical protein
VSSIEVFSILYNPETKHYLAQYWQYLEQFKYDPVVEYNRALEVFVARYNPNNEEIFVILIQLSRFFRELSDFETNKIPHFMHPALKGNTELKAMTILGDLELLGDDIYLNAEKHTPMEKKKEINIDNPIARENFKNDLLMDMNAERKFINYYYKRWIWVQFPWFTINVYEDITDIM